MKSPTLDSVRRRREQRGATLVEFSLTFLLFLVILLGIMEMSRMMWTYSTIAHAARQGARYCMVHGSMNTAVLEDLEAVVHRSSTGLQTDQITISPIWNPDTGRETADPASVARGDIAEVRVTYPFQFITGDLLVEAGSLTLATTTRIVVAN